MKHLFKIILLTGFLFAIQSHLNAQPATWQRLYNGQFYNSSDNGRGISETKNGNMYVTGFELSQAGIRCIVLKIKPNGDTIWVKYINNDVNDIRGSFIISTIDGGCIICGDARSVFTIKLDSNGNQIWLRYYGSFGTLPTDIIRTKDSGYAISGYQSGVLPAPAYVLKN